MKKVFKLSLSQVKLGEAKVIAESETEAREQFALGNEFDFEDYSELTPYNTWEIDDIEEIENCDYDI